MPVAKPPEGYNDGKWFLVPADDLVAYEAYEFAILQINQMREECDGFHLAPLRMQNYEAAQVFRRDEGLFSRYVLNLEGKNGLAPSDIRVHVARQNSVTDLSLFQVSDVDPLPCSIYSALDDAELLVPWDGEMAARAKEAALNVMNEQRQVLCPQRPSLQFIRLIAASLQPIEGFMVRLLIELREASESFHTQSFADIVSVVYALDLDVPGQITISPEVYPTRKPCDMMYLEEEQSAGDLDNKTAASPQSGRRLRSWRDWGPRLPSDWTTLRRLRDKASAATAVVQIGEGRRLPSSDYAGGAAASDDAEMVREFKDEGLDFPNHFDPRLERTLCYPRGLSRKQGSCGSSWAFAATAVAALRECLHNLRTGQSSGLQFFSVQELISCRSFGGCSGGDAGSAFYYLKRYGIARESCSAYRMRCFTDNSIISTVAADKDTSSPKSAHFKPSSRACSLTPDPESDPCKCLPQVYHPALPVQCRLLPNSCEKTQLPHYFRIAGTAEGNTVPEMERHMMQEILSVGPVTVSFLVYEDFFDPVCWTESGIYIHKHGHLVGKHAVVAVGWGTDDNSRDYWLLMNSFGNGWQQEGYFKLMRGENSLDLMKYGAWAVDWRASQDDQERPGISNVEVSFSPKIGSAPAFGADPGLKGVVLEVTLSTSERSLVLVRVEGLTNSVSGEAKDADYTDNHLLQIDLLKIGLVDEVAKIELWAVDDSKNTQSWGPYTFHVPSANTFKKVGLGRRLRVKTTVDHKVNHTLNVPVDTFV